MTSTLLYSMSIFLWTGCTASEKTEDSSTDAIVPSTSSNIEVRMETSMGEFVIELDVANAPITTANFLRYVDDGFFDGNDELGLTTFHRVVADFVIQGGGYTENGTEKTTYDPIENEAIASGLSNLRGTLAMARTNEPGSATSQFFVNIVDNTFLDPGESTADGYAVFGAITSGMDVVDEISGVSVDANDQPTNDITIDSVSRMNVQD
jgi:cyclophilin family peptidyl-prolyl cis-trans isomerase